MCPSIPTHNSYISKLRLLLKIDGETNGLSLQWVSCIPGTTTQDVPLLIWNLPRGESGAKDLIVCPGKGILIEVAAYPTKVLVAQHI